MQDALYQRRERFLWELLAHATGGAIREAITALGPSASAYARVKKVFKSYRSLATRKKTMLDAEWDHPEGKCFNMNPGRRPKPKPDTMTRLRRLAQACSLAMTIFTRSLPNPGCILTVVVGYV